MATRSSPAADRSVSSPAFSCSVLRSASASCSSAQSEAGTRSGSDSLRESSVRDHVADWSS